MYTWGCNDDGALGRPTVDGEDFLPGRVILPFGVEVMQVSAGDSHSAIVTKKGEVYAWGAYRVRDKVTQGFHIFRLASIMVTPYIFWGKFTSQYLNHKLYSGCTLP